MKYGFCLRRGAAAVLAAWLLLVGTPQPTCADDPKSAAAILLIATTELPDPDFSDSVVLVMNNLGPAPVGIIVNRPTQVAVAQLFPELKRLTSLPDKVYFGGPVEFETVWFLFRSATPSSKAIQVLDGLFLSANRELLLQLLSRDKPLDGLRIFIGHAGWAPGQLEAEIASGAWKLERADSGSIFDAQSEHPWPSTPPAPQLPRRST